MEGYRRQINHLMDLTSYFTARIKETEGYELVVNPVWHAASNSGSYKLLFSQNS